MLRRFFVDKKKPFAIDVRGVSKRFWQGGESVEALKNVSLQAHSGEILMIVGPSGCGKTTLLSAIAGTLRFEKGEIDVFGNALHALSTQEIAKFRRENIGFIFQQYHLVRNLTCLENLTIPLLLNGMDRKSAEKMAFAALEKVGLKGREKAEPKRLSGGQQQRIAIARALVHAPRLIICDEPTAALDGETGHKIMELIQEVASDNNRCVIVVTHDSRIFKYANRIVKMDDGQVIQELSNESILKY